jgi:hypothetical protein
VLSTYPAGGANEVLLDGGILAPQPPWNGSIDFCMLRHAPPRAPVKHESKRFQQRALFLRTTVGRTGLAEHALNIRLVE